MNSTWIPCPLFYTHQTRSLPTARMMCIHKRHQALQSWLDSDLVYVYSVSSIMYVTSVDLEIWFFKRYKTVYFVFNGTSNSSVTFTSPTCTILSWYYCTDRICDSIVALLSHIIFMTKASCFVLFCIDVSKYNFLRFQSARTPVLHVCTGCILHTYKSICHNSVTWLAFIGCILWRTLTIQWHISPT